MKKQEKNQIQVQLFKNLIEKETDLKHLSKTLTDLYFEYSRMVIRQGAEGGAVYPGTEDQLFWLNEIIRVLDPRESDRKMLAA